MSTITKYVQSAFRLVAVLGALAALFGFVAVAAAAVAAAEASGVSVPFSVPLTNDQVEQAFVGGGVAFVGGLLVNVVANTVASFVAGLRQPAGGPAAGTGGGPAAADDGSAVPTPEVYLEKLQHTYLWLGGFVSAVVVAGVAAGALDPGGAGFGSVLGFVLALAAVGVELLFGGVAGGVGTVAVLLGLWYGTRRGASEAILAGVVVALLFVPTALVFGSIAWLAFAATMLYYNLRARRATEFVWLTPGSIPAGVRSYVE